MDWDKIRVLVIFIAVIVIGTLFVVVFHERDYSHHNVPADGTPWPKGPSPIVTDPYPADYHSEPALIACPKCNGSGWIKCECCYGTGRVPLFDSLYVNTECGQCNGTGTEKCYICNGTGKIKRGSIYDTKGE